MAEFEDQWNFPNICGALGGKHVQIQRPNSTGSYWYNYEHSFSTILFAVVDANYNFLYIDVGTNGRIHNAAVFDKSTFKAALDDGRLKMPARGLFVGDDASPLRTDLLKPYPRSGIVSERERISN